MTLQIALPGRLNELELHQVVIDCEGLATFVNFTFFIDGNWAGVTYDITTHLWAVVICDTHFPNIALPTFHLVCDCDAVKALQKLLVEGSSKNKKQIQALQYWRNLMQVQHVKVLSLKK